MAPKKETFADRLRSLREAAGITQYRLAQLSGVTKQSISRLEAGQQPSWETVLSLARGLGVEVGAFVAETAEMPAEPIPQRPRGRPPKATPATPPAEDLEATAKKTRARPRKKS